MRISKLHNKSEIGLTVGFYLNSMVSTYCCQWHSCTSCFNYFMSSSSYVVPLQCCHLCWYQGTASSMRSIQCCLASATLYSRMSRTCRRMPPSQNPFLRPTQCPPISRIHRQTVTQTHREAVAVPTFLIHHPALTLAVHSRCQVRSNSDLPLFFSFNHTEQQQLNSLLFDLPPSGRRDSPSCLHAPRGADDSGLSPANGH